MQQSIQATDSAVDRTVARSGARGREARRGTEEARTQRAYCVPTALPALPPRCRLNFIGTRTARGFRRYVDHRGGAMSLRRAVAAWLGAHGAGRGLEVVAIRHAGRHWAMLESSWDESTGRWSAWRETVRL